MPKSSPDAVQFVDLCSLAGDALPRMAQRVAKLPCTDAQARSSSAWAGPGACEPPYHIGAATGYRSTSGYASVPGTNHGQQCCYDSAGLLITEGAGAGTPDIVQAPAESSQQLREQSLRVPRVSARHGRITGVMLSRSTISAGRSITDTGFRITETIVRLTESRKDSEMDRETG